METTDRIAGYLTRLELRYQRLAEEGFQLGFSGKHSAYSVLIDARPPLLRFFAPDVLLVPPSRLDEALRLVNTVNAVHLRAGAFWVRPSDGGLSFELVLPSPAEATFEQVGGALALVTSAVDTFFPAIARVVWGGLGATAALLDRGDALTDDDGLDIAV